jgi:hypothetical protein
MLSERYLHPNGQIPAYEWNFGRREPAGPRLATLFSYYTSADRTGEGDKRFLARAFQKLLLNFTWWVNRKDPSGNNVFEGGFLGLDNIGVFDRSAQLPGGGRLEQADGTAWMAFFCQNMLQIALELGRDDPSYEPMVVKFVEHFLWIASSMDCVGNTCDEMWDEEDGFFYDVLVFPTARPAPQDPLHGRVAALSARRRRFRRREHAMPGVHETARGLPEPRRSSWPTSTRRTSRRGRPLPAQRVRREEAAPRS